MKKSLLASTALVAMSGAAFAQGVTLSGSAEMGIIDNGEADVQYHQDVDVTLKMEAMTDGGLTFGTAVDLDEDAGAVGTGHGGVAVYINGPFGNVNLGDTDGGFDWAMHEVGGAGSIADDHTAHGGFNGNSGLDGANDGQILRYDNSFGDFGLAFSFEQDVAGDGAGDVVGVGAKGSLAGFGFGIGYQQHDDANIAGMSANAGFGEMSAALNFSRKSVDDGEDVTHTGIGVTYESGAVAINVNFGRHDHSGDTEDADGVGFAAQYDLGGGAKAQLGVGSSDGDNTWSLGLAMSF